MFQFTRTGVFFISIIIIFFLVQVFIHNYSIQSEINEEIIEMQIEGQNEVIERGEKIEIWQIEIPRISLIANIEEGATSEILNKNIGHLKNTSRDKGNVGLVGYNRGHNVNYFKDLKLLKKGDEIKYKYNTFEKIYEVEKCRIIKKHEWEYFEETEENMLTLITWIKNQPEYRRCIQAVEKEEEIY